MLHHGFPTTDLKGLAAALPSPPNDGIDTLEAIAATQAAVWHFSDAVDLNRDDPLSGDGSDDEDAEDALALYDFLTGPANTGIEESPIPTLEIDPAKLDGKPGTRIGPFKVSTTATIEELKAELPEGVRVTDAKGNELAAAAIKNGTELFLDVPKDTADGDGKFELTHVSGGGNGPPVRGRELRTDPDPVPDRGQVGQDDHHRGGRRELDRRPGNHDPGNHHPGDHHLGSLDVQLHH